MSAKAALKAAKAALDAGKYDAVIKEAHSALSLDANNYFAQLFLGRAYEKLGKPEDATSSYQSAAKVKPDDAQAWQGLYSVYESQGAAKLHELQDVSVQLVQIFAQADDKHRSQTIVDKVIAFSKHGTADQYKRALELLLPGSPVFDLLEGRIQHPSVTYARLVEITENEEAQTIKQEIASRRTRIGARLGQVTNDVKREVFAKSDLEGLLQQAINWTSDDETRRQYEEKLLQRAYEVLLSLPVGRKATKLDQVLTLSEGMVIIHHNFRIAWDLVLETRDLDDLQELDVNILREYITFFPDAGLTKILRAWLSSELSPFPTAKHTGDEAGDLDKQIAPEDRLVLMTEGLSACEGSPLAHRVVSDYYLHLEEIESAVDTARAGLQCLAAKSNALGMSLQNTKDALNSVLATALVQYQAPRNHAEAQRLFEEILTRKSKWTPALIGLGMVFEENEDYASAISFFSRALDEDRSNVSLGAELSWCKALNGDYATALQELETYLANSRADDPRARDVRAQILYRIGRCTWELDASKAARKSRDGAYRSFLAAIKMNVNHAPSYTSLGHYYADYTKDRKRARQCFQKAFELSPAETDAAECLARYFSERADWHIVEVIAQRVIDSGRARPPPGSKRKGLSWPYSALGVVQMNKLEYQKAITSFLAALRIAPNDYQSYIGLGESYHNSGRYNSALRTFSYALAPSDGAVMNVQGETWFARYMLANVHRELGEYDEAIEGLCEVLAERPNEFGVLISLLQTYVEQSSRCLNLGLYGQAISSACEAIDVATRLSTNHSNAFNMWKAVGDACAIFSWIQSGHGEFPLAQTKKLLSTDSNKEMFEPLSDIDLVESVQLGDDEQDKHVALTKPEVASILAYKRAIYCCSRDNHAQAVAWYNLGMAEYRAYVCTSHRDQPNSAKPFVQAAVRCLKRAIELEAGNPEFWNALGVVTSTLNLKVAQHSFVRSLHLSELNAKVWTNLGVFYLLQNDLQLSHEAFGRAQSTDPDYAHAWVGEGLIALLSGDHKEALSHFTHAFEISDSSSTITKQLYATSLFDHLLSIPSASNDLTSLIQPIFALAQLRRQIPDVLSLNHLGALFLERVGNHTAAIETLTVLCDTAEADYESTESLSALARFAHAKSDLARNLLAARSFEDAAVNAETAIDLSSDAANCGLDAESRIKLRLSAHLTAGLSYNYLERYSDSIAMFRAALHESNSDPNVVVSLVRVLWKHGGVEEQNVAREQLLACVESHPNHVPSLTLLAAIAALEDDGDTLAAVIDDINTLRTSENNLDVSERDSIENLLSTVATLQPSHGVASGSAALNQAQTAIMLAPDNYIAWTALAKHEGSAEAAWMALETSHKAVPPSGSIDAEGLAAACADVGTIAAAQRAVVHAPWDARNWEALHETLELT